MDQPAQQRSPSQSMHRQTAVPSSSSCQIQPSSSNFSLAFPHSATVQSLLRHTSQIRSSRTWTPSSAGLGLLSDADEVQDRGIFVLEYNRLAKKHGVRLLIVEDFGSQQQGDETRSPEKRSWLYRLFRGSPSHHPSPSKPAPLPRPRHRRSVSDLGYLIHARREPPRLLDIQTMVRLSGKSVLYLPQDYSPCSLILPTCIRATAQHIAQNVTARGIFRIPGSVKIVNSLFDYYCYMDDDSLDVAGTVCCATLPTHIPYSVHDVASTFKRLLSVLPGGILGSLSLFDAFVGIHSQLHGEPEFPRTKQTKVRARLIALAIGTIESQFRRELICAVFGLLSLIGRVAEVSPREDVDGRPLPTSDLMGYSALGIVFGPLLVGDLLDKYTMKLATPTSGLLLFPLSPKKQRRDRHKEKAEVISKLESPPVDKVMVANGITEMLITNWRDVVRQMKALGTHYRHETASMRLRRGQVKPSAAESFVIRMPQDLDEAKMGNAAGGLGGIDRDHSPEPETPTLALKRRRSRPMRKRSGNMLSTKTSTHPLSPTIEEGTLERETLRDRVRFAHDEAFSVDGKGKPVAAGMPTSSSPRSLDDEDLHYAHNATSPAINPDHSQATLRKHGDDSMILQTPNVYMDSAPPRLSSRQGRYFDGSVTTSTILSSSDESPENAVCAPRQRSFEQPDRDAGFDQVLENCPHIGQAIVDSRLRESTRPSRTPSLKNAGKSSTIESNLPLSQEPHSESCHHGLEMESLGLNNSGDSAISPDFLSQKGAKQELSHEALTHESLPNVDDEAILSLGAIQVSGLGQSEKPPVGIKLSDFISVASDTGSRSRGESISAESHTIGSTGSGTPIKRRSVKAMAAMFKSQQAIQPMSPTRRQIRPGESHMIMQGESLDECAEEESEPMPLWAHCSPQRSPQLSKDRDNTPNMSVDGQFPRHDLLRQVMGVLTQAKEQSESQERLLDESEQPRTSDAHGTRMLKDPFPGTSSVDHPLYSPPPVPRSGDNCFSQANALRTTVAADSTDTLQSQIRNLERLLDIKTEEVEQLRDRLQTRESSGTGTLSHQLKTANEDLRKWRERAEAAERRMRMFEKFTTKLRGIQNSIVAESSRRSSGHLLGSGDVEAKNCEDTQGACHVHRVRFAEGSGIVGVLSDDSGMLEDESVVPARIRNCLHHKPGKYEPLLDAPGDMLGMDGAASPRESRDDRMPSFELAAVEMWIVAQELLRMEEEASFQLDPSVAGVDGSSLDGDR